ncbi:MAG: glycerol-3-phosphate 1-O-acyltransferase PlsY [Anaerolineales bacterium]|nr:glycerol-3-phosphate 1-O-acyltransferase PlsY [Anaerolineales bacterium]
MNLIVLVSIIVAFLIGGIPFGYLLVKKYKKLDIRKIGSGNIGSTNVRRAAGAALSKITQGLDILKGVIPVAAVLVLSRHIRIGIEESMLWSATAFAAILGHDFTPYLGFRGGKGVNTTIGAFLLLAPIPVLGGISIFYLLGLVTPIVSIRSLALGISIPILATLLKMPEAIILASCLASLMLFLRHYDNIKRLFSGTELRP